MTDELLDRSTLSKFAALALGIMIGGPLGPLVFGVTGLSDPAAATTRRLLHPAYYPHAAQRTFARHPGRESPHRQQ